jgi:IMP dehydrogenase
VSKLISDISRTFSEYLLIPGLTKKSHTIAGVSLATPISAYQRGEQPKIQLNIPFVSASMQSVTGEELAIKLAREGGLGFIYCSQSIEFQAQMVSKVKLYKAGFVRSDSNAKPTTTLKELLDIMEDTGHSTVPVTDNGQNDGLFLGIVTDNDFWEFEDALDQPVEAFMTPESKVVFGRQGISLTEANRLLRKNKKECLPVLTDEGKLHSLVFKKDYIDHMQNPDELLDAKKQLLVGAAVNSHDYQERVPALVDAGVDVLCFDSSDGYSEYQKDAILWVKERYRDQVVVGAGNVVSAAGFDYLVNECNSDFVKVGIGGGSICITREQKGIGRGQASAVMDVAQARERHYQKTGTYIPICSDGGLSNDTQVMIALAMGADFVMMGRYFAMTDESPPSKILVNGKMYKPYWGEGSFRARNWQRYSDTSNKVVKEMVFEEGVDAYVPTVGPLKSVLSVTLQKIKSTLVNLGSMTLKEFQDNAELTLISQQSFMEGGTSNVQTRSINTSLSDEE